MSRAIFLDDIRYPENAFEYMRDSIYLKTQWVICRNYQEFKCGIDLNGVPDLISYDHDLADEHYDIIMYHGSEKYSELYPKFKEKTGLDCARYIIDLLIDLDKPHPEYLVHSMNPAGKENILKLIQNYNQKNNDR